MLDSYLTTREAAAIIGVTSVRVAELCKNGTLRATRVGQLWLIPREALDDPAFRNRRPGRTRKDAPCAT